MSLLVDPNLVKVSNYDEITGEVTLAQYAAVRSPIAEVAWLSMNKSFYTNAHAWSLKEQSISAEFVQMNFMQLSHELN